MTLGVTYCPKCKVKMQSVDSREHTAYGFPTMKRRRACTKCSFRITTIELPIDLGDSIFEDE